MWNLQDAKTHFSSLVADALAGRPQHVSRRGKPAVVVLSEAEYRALVGAAQAGRESFAAHLLAFPAGDEDIPRADAAPRDVVF